MRNLHRILLLGWSVLMLTVLCWGLISLNGVGDEQLRYELLLRHALLMLALAFPVGILFGGVFWWLLGVAGLQPPTGGHAEVAVVWVILATASYAQWFVFLPWLWRKWRASSFGATRPKEHQDCNG